jgi:hypothetical protein
MHPRIAELIIDLRKQEFDTGYGMFVADRKADEVKKVSSRALSYVEKYGRDIFFNAEYDFREIQIAQHSDGYISRSIRKKINRILTAGFTLVSPSDDPLNYVKARLSAIALATSYPTECLVRDFLFDASRYNNCIAVKTRSAELSDGDLRFDLNGRELKPVAGYHILPLETLRFRAKENGELLEVEQRMVNGTYKVFKAKDILHFSTNKSPGFFLGTPELIPAIDDIVILRRIEENIQDLIETNLFPVYHYTVGTDAMPERMSPEGYKESDKLATKIKFMNPGQVIVSDHRHKITAVGSEGRSLKIEGYIDHFKKRVFASLGTSGLDMGESDSANRSTASTLSKGMLLDIEALTLEFTYFFNNFVLNELLMEGGYDILDPEQQVKIQFGVIDKEERRADENQIIQLFSANLIDIDEARIALGRKVFDEDQIEKTHYKMFGEPAELLKAAQVPLAAGEALAQSPTSSITPEGVKKEEKQRNEENKLAKKAAAQKPAAGAKPQKSGRPTTRKNGTSTNRSRPANQYGKRSSAKTTKDVEFPNNQRIMIEKDLADSPNLDSWVELVWQRYESMDGFNVSLQSVAESMLWRLNE